MWWIFGLDTIFIFFVFSSVTNLKNCQTCIKRSLSYSPRVAVKYRFDYSITHPFTKLFWKRIEERKREKRIAIISLHCKRSRASSSRMLGWEQKRDQEWKGRRWGEKETSYPLPLLSFCFFCRSNFGAITRLETLTTPANKAQDLMTSNDKHNSLMIHQEPLSWAPGFTLSQSRCFLLLLKGKCTEATYCYYMRFHLNDWPDLTVIQSSRLWTDGMTPQLVLR